MEDNIHMVIRNRMVDMLVRANKKRYEKCVHMTKKRGRLVYVLLGERIYAHDYFGKI